MTRGKLKKAQVKAQVTRATSRPLSAEDIDMTASAEAVYSDLARKAREAEKSGNYASAHCTTFNMVRDAITRVIANDPHNRKYALRGSLSNIFRVKKGRLRICWISSSKLNRVCILFIAETLRKEGDASDPYVIFQNLIDSGRFDRVFEQFGVRMPRLSPEYSSKKPH